MAAWVFGYGSLMCRPSLVEFLGREPRPGEWSLAILSGYRRLWNAAMDNTAPEPGTRFWARPDGSRHEGTVTYLGLEESGAARVNGAVFRVATDELALFDRRELRYDRVEVTHRIESPAEGAVFTYVPRRDAVARHELSAARGADRIAHWYLDRVTQGFQREGDSCLQEFVATTAPLPSPVEELYPHRIPP